MRRLLWMGVFVVGCKGGDKPNIMDDAPQVIDPDAAIDAPPDAYEVVGTMAISGTRLKVAWATTPDGIKIDVPTASDFYDSVFQRDCRVEKWSDGITRCTPEVPRVVYADSQCTSPLALEEFLIPLAPLWVQRATNTAASVDALYTVGSQVVATQYWQRMGQSCMGRPLGPDDKLYGVTPVAGIPTITEVKVGGGSLQQVWWTSTDGLQVPRRFVAHDATIGTNCSIRTNYFVNPIEPGECEVTTETRFYHDTTCSTPVTRVSPGGIQPTYVSSACSRKVHTLGTTTTASPLSMRGVNQACGSLTPSGTDTFYLFGPEVGEEQIATFAQESVPGHRLQPITYTNIGIWSGWFHDTTLDIDCALTRNGCFPSAIASSRRVYTDAACTVGIDVVQIGSEFEPACPTKRPPAFARDSNNQVHRVAGQHVGSLKVKAGSNCDPISFETPPDQKFFDLDATVIPDSAFETATYSVDP